MKTKNQKQKNRSIKDRLCAVVFIIILMSIFYYTVEAREVPQAQVTGTEVIGTSLETSKIVDTTEVTEDFYGNVCAGISLYTYNILSSYQSTDETIDVQATEQNFTKTGMSTEDEDNTDLNSTEEVEEGIEEVSYCYKYEYAGWITNTLNVRSTPDTESDVLGHLRFNEQVVYSYYENNPDNEWAVIEYNDDIAYISKHYISDTEFEYTSESVSGDKRKSYMDYKCITSRSSKQWKVQHEYAYTASNGVRAVNGRYCIALGSYYTHTVGQYVDLILENGTVIECIIGDCKDDKDTVDNHSMGIDGGVAEFVVDTPALSKKVRQMGDVSYASDNWLSNVVEIRILDKNLFD